MSKLPSIRIATPEEKAAYRTRTPKPVYPLYGFAKLDGHVVVVEDLRGHWSAPDPLYEALAPDGFVFSSDTTHTLLGTTLTDLRERLAEQGGRGLPALSECSCPDCAKTAPPVTVKVGAGLMEVLQLDDAAMVKEAGYAITALEPAGKGYVHITTTREGAKRLLADCQDRWHGAASWDQPLWYASTAKAAAKRLEAALTPTTKE